MNAPDELIVFPGYPMDHIWRFTGHCFKTKEFIFSPCTEDNIILLHQHKS